ncbi:MAG: hypothetical protein E5W57_04185 [Mesorhizobium sp.]|nr:MAG: hypothetical protein E5W57_04185 [Mesorhizobium sp.]
MSDMDARQAYLAARHEGAIASRIERTLSTAVALVDKHINAAVRCKDEELYKNGVPIGIVIQDYRELRESVAALGHRASDEDCVDAERWRALMSSQRMHFMGCAGINLVNKPGTTGRKTADLIPVMKDGEQQHFGMEFWSEHQAFGDPRYPDDFERALLVAYVDKLRAKVAERKAD